MGSRAIWIKLIILAGVTLLLSIVLLRIGFLVDERQARQHEAVRGVAQAQAGEQVLLGPLLQRSCTEEWQAKGEEMPSRRDFTLTAVPAKLQVGGMLNPEARYRGLFKVNGYVARLKLEADWADLKALDPPSPVASRVSCGEPRVMLALSDARGLRSVTVTHAGRELAVQPASRHPDYPRGLHALLPAPAMAAPDQPLHLGLQLELVGMQQFALVPAAAATQVSLQSEWPHPSFGGRFLPSQREVSEQGFKAQWQVSELATSAVAEVLAGQPIPGLGGSGKSGKEAEAVDTLAVDLLDPINPYVMSDRAIKYGLMFILLTFVSVGLLELVSRRRVHPVQYLMVGLALSLFFLLLLSLSEHLAFGLSYSVASGAAVALLGSYGAAMLGDWRRGLGFGALIALLYGALYVLLSMEQTALLIGAVLMFVVLAAVMMLTRRIDWYALGSR